MTNRNQPQLSTHLAEPGAWLVAASAAGGLVAALIEFLARRRHCLHPRRPARHRIQRFTAGCVASAGEPRTSKRVRGRFRRPGRPRHSRHRFRRVDARGQLASRYDDPRGGGVDHQRLLRCAGKTGRAPTFIPLAGVSTMTRLHPSRSPSRRELPAPAWRWLTAGLVYLQRRSGRAEVCNGDSDHAGQCRHSDQSLGGPHRRRLRRQGRQAGLGLVGDTTLRQQHGVSVDAVLPDLRAGAGHR